jgi:hypothetical protein
VLLNTKAREKCARVHHEFRKMAIMLGISPKNPNVLLKYLGGLHNHLRKKVMLFNPGTIDEACVKARYLICNRGAHNTLNLPTQILCGISFLNSISALSLMINIFSA